MYGRTVKRVISKSWLSFLCLLLLSCGDERNEQKWAAHHLKSTVSLGAEDLRIMDQFHLERLYVRYFDIEWENQKILPTHGVKWKTSLRIEAEIVPFIKIHNAVLNRLNDSISMELAAFSYARIERINQEQQIEIKEIQIHADFTPENQSAYFNFLNLFKQICERDGIELSVGLHVSHFSNTNQTQIPPAHRLMLMVMNTGDRADWQEQNSILHPSHHVFEQVHFDPIQIPVDWSFPLYSWVLQYRDDTLIKVHSAWDSQTLGDSLFKRINENTFVAGTDTFCEDKQGRKAEIKKADHFRFEMVHPETWKEIQIKLAAAGLKSPQFISIYHYNPDEFRNLDSEVIQNGLNMNAKRTD